MDAARRPSRVLPRAPRNQRVSSYASATASPKPVTEKHSGATVFRARLFVLGFVFVALRQVVRDTLALPTAWEPQGMFFIGQPAAQPKPKELKPLADLVKYL